MDKEFMVNSIIKEAVNIIKKIAEGGCIYTYDYDGLIYFDCFYCEMSQDEDELEKHEKDCLYVQAKDFMNKFNGKELKKIRKSKGLTIREMASKLKCNLSEISDIEHDREDAMPNIIIGYLFVEKS